MLKWFKREKDKEKSDEVPHEPGVQPGTRPDPAEEEPETPPFSVPQEPPSQEPKPPTPQPAPEKRPDSGKVGVLEREIDRREGGEAIPPVLDLSPEDITPEVEEEIEPEGEIVTETAAITLEAEAPTDKKGFFGRLRDRLTKTKDALVEKVRSVVHLHGKVDEELLEEIESIMIQSDIGVPTTLKIVDRIRTEGRKKGTLTPETVLALFKESIESILCVNARTLELTAKPMIVLMVGVNGTGKTTTIGKMAKQWHDRGKKVMMVAADTFRAAAIDQLAVWAQRTNALLIRPEERADPAAVVYEALETAKREKPDLILIDTAGRLHTKINLMEELKKIVRVIQKHHPEAPHETLLALDATTGQNAMNQVKIFHDACTLTGLIMTKLDGTAKGGVLIACKDMYDLPILKIGIGEAAEDLRDFNPHEFVDALFSNGNGAKR